MVFARIQLILLVFSHFWKIDMRSLKSCPFGYTIEDYEEYGDYHEYEEEPFDDYEYYPEF